jgi:hypothetical protein
MAIDTRVPSVVGELPDDHLAAGLGSGNSGVIQLGGFGEYPTTGFAPYDAQLHRISYATQHVTEPDFTREGLARAYGKSGESGVPYHTLRIPQVSRIFPEHQAGAQVHAALPAAKVLSGDAATTPTPGPISQRRQLEVTALNGAAGVNQGSGFINRERLAIPTSFEISVDPPRLNAYRGIPPQTPVLNIPMYSRLFPTDTDLPFNRIDADVEPDWEVGFTGSALEQLAGTSAPTVAEGLLKQTSTYALEKDKSPVDDGDNEPRFLEEKQSQECLDWRRGSNNEDGTAAYAGNDYDQLEHAAVAVDIGQTSLQTRTIKPLDGSLPPDAGNGAKVPDGIREQGKGDQLSSHAWV